MDPIETAIRNALKKGDAEDKAFRARVYRSAYSALHRVLEEGENITPAEAAKRRDNLKARIAEIESEYIPASLEPEFAHLAPENGNGLHDIRVEPEVDPALSPSIAPELGAQRRETPDTESGLSPEPELRVENDAGPAGSDPDFVAPRRDVERPARQQRATGRKRRSFPTWLAALIVLVIIVAGGWYFLQDSALLGGPEKTGWHPPQTLEQESSDGSAEAPKKEGQADAEQKWITIFTPDDPTTVGAAGSQAGVMQEGDAKFLRMISAPQSGGVTFDVGQGVLEQIAGKHALFDVVARAQEGKDTQMSVSCDFGTLGTCERKRYEVRNQRNDFLFEMDVPNARPGGAGKISIVSDIGAQGKPVDIYEIRVSTTPQK